MNEEYIVIKVGGSCLRRNGESAVDQICRLAGQRAFVLVHGYGAELRDLLSILGIERRTFTSASGVPSHQTTEEVAELSALAASRVKNVLAQQFERAGIATKAIPAYWDGLVTGSRKERIRYVEDGIVRVRHDDFSGKVSNVNVDGFVKLCQKHRSLIVSAILRGGGQETLVIDADRLAIDIALALKARNLYILSDQKGVLVNGVTVPNAKLSDIAKLEPYVTAGMSRKLRLIKAALEVGISKIFLLDGINAPLSGTPHGTVFSRN
jgi:[amino group carrier protein]-L-2-aminoadipate/L-glutamate 6-kinase